MLYPTIIFSQTPTWPFAFSKPICANMPGAGSNCTKWPDVPNGQWDNPVTWNNNTLPGNFDIVCIPTGWTVVVKGSTYVEEATCQGSPATSPRLFIFVCGTISFEPSGKLFLSCGSAIEIKPGGTITAGAGSSDLIKIGSTTVWGGPGSGTQPNLVGPYTITQSGQGPGLLPSALMHFTAQIKRAYEVTIDWATASETNSLEFEVERSNDNKNWVSLCTIKAKGNSNTKINYSYIDKSLSTGINYYRLKQIDANGSFVYSSIASITNRNAGKIVVYPNPVSSTATLYSSEAWSKNQSLQIVDVNGALVQSESITGGNTIQFSTSKLSAGLYLVRVIENGKTVSQTKLIKQ